MAKYFRNILFVLKTLASLGDANGQALIMRCHNEEI